MAGGGGTRLWPASTAPRPKQLLDPLLGAPTDDGTPSDTLVAQTVARLAGLVDAADVWVVVGHDQLEGVREALPQLPAQNFVVEPARRNTAPCIALSVAHIRASIGSDADTATLIVLPADHHVRQPHKLRGLLAAACAHAEAAHTIVTLGIEPDHPATGFGYLERMPTPLPAVEGDDGVPVFAAKRFVEKPDRATAQQFVDAKVYAWNAGIFVMPLSRIETELQEHCAPMWQALAPVRTALDGQGPDAVNAATRVAYRAVEGSPIDIAVMEKQADLRVITASVGWTDLGSWRSVHAIGTPDPKGNVCIAAPGAQTVVQDGEGNLVWSEDATVGVLGVSGLAVVASGGRVLVCPLDRAEEVKALLTRLDD